MFKNTHPILKNVSDFYILSIPTNIVIYVHAYIKKVQRSIYRYNKHTRSVAK